MKGFSKNEQRKRTQRDNSLAFKMEVVADVEKGDITYKKAQKKCGIQGRSTVLMWLRKHDRLDWRTKGPMSGKQTPNKKIRELEKKLERLKAEKEILNRAIDIADKELGTDIRKKYYALLSKASAQQGSPDNDSTASR